MSKTSSISSSVSNGKMLCSLSSIAIIMGLANGLINALPRLIAKAPEIVQKLVTAIINNAPKLIQAAFELIVTLAKGLIQNLPQLLSSALQIVGSIASGIISGLGSVASAAWEVVKSIGNIIGDLPKKALQWGKDMIQGFINGIKAVKDKIKGAVSGVADKIKSFLHFSRPDEGPLRDYEKWMPDMMKGLASGIRNNMGLVEKEVASLASSLSPDLSMKINPYSTMKEASSPLAFAGGNNSFNITVNVSQMNSDYDVRRAADIMAQELSRLTTENNSLVGVVG